MLVIAFINGVSNSESRVLVFIAFPLSALREKGGPDLLAFLGHQVQDTLEPQGPVKVIGFLPSLVRNCVCGPNPLPLVDGLVVLTDQGEDGAGRLGTLVGLHPVHSCFSSKVPIVDYFKKCLSILYVRHCLVVN